MSENRKKLDDTMLENVAGGSSRDEKTLTFCKYCGGLVSVSNPKYFICPSCGKRVDEESK